MTETITRYINATWIHWAFVIAYGVTILSIIGVVLSENRNPLKSLSWITVLLAFPGIGLILYLLFGRSIKNKRYISRRNRRRLKKHEPARSFSEELSGGLSEASCQLIRLGQGLIGAPFYRGNSAQFFAEGREKFEALMADIASARHFVYLQYYIINDDRIGREIADLLIKKAREGVDVKVIYDHVGSFRTKRRYFKHLRESGVEVYPFFKVRFPILGTRINWRNHRKISIIDGNIGYIGGMNVADRYIDNEPRRWHDGHLRVQGPIIRSLLHSFSADWVFMGKSMPRGVDLASPSPQSEDYGMQLLTSGPVGQWSNIAMEFQKAIGDARKTIWIQTPYFLPNEGLLKALQSAALAKVDVRLMMPLRSDSSLLRYASFSFVKECLQAGIKIYLYTAGMLHAKMMIVDDEMVTIGSTNFDFRSFEHNFESNLFVYSRQFNEQMRQHYINDIKDCKRVIPYEWSRRPRRHKAMESITRLFSPIL